MVSEIASAYVGTQAAQSQMRINTAILKANHKAEADMAAMIENAARAANLQSGVGTRLDVKA